MATQQQGVQEIAEKLYKENKQRYIKDLSSHIESRINSGMAEIKNGDYIDRKTFKENVMNISL